MPPEVFEEFLNWNSGLVPVLYTVRFFCLDRKGSKEKKIFEYFLTTFEGAFINHPSFLIHLKLKGHLHRYKLHQLF